MNRSTSVTWVSERYCDPVVKEFVHELNQLATQFVDSVYKDEGEVSLNLKDRRTRKKYLEYWPHKNKICRTRENHDAIGVPKALSDAYHRLIDLSGNPVSDVTGIIDLLRRMIDERVE